MINLLKQLISAPSFSREEDKRASLLEQWMSAHGLDVHRKGNNLWASNGIEDSRPTILLNAHIDTVHPIGWDCDPFTPREDGDRIIGLGSNDDLGSVVAMMEAFKILVRKKQPYNLVFCASAEEEISGKGGIEMILDDIGCIKLGIIGEPTAMQMAVAERGLMVLDCASHGQSGHAARNDGVNAIYKALRDIEWFRTYSFPLVSEYLGEVHMCVSQINAGVQHNVIPDLCSFVVDVRGNGMYTNNEILDIIRSNVTCDVNPRSTRLNSSFSGNNAFVRRAEAYGIEKFGSSTLSNQAVLDFDTVKIGPGDSSRSHKAGEYILKSEIEEAVKIYVKLLDNLEV